MKRLYVPLSGITNACKPALHTVEADPESSHKETDSTPVDAVRLTHLENLLMYE